MSTAKTDENPRPKLAGVIGYAAERCPTCKGCGKVGMLGGTDHNGIITWTMKCAVCDGTGKRHNDERSAMNRQLPPCDHDGCSWNGCTARNELSADGTHKICPKCRGLCGKLVGQTWHPCTVCGGCGSLAPAPGSVK